MYSRLIAANTENYYAMEHGHGGELKLRGYRLWY